jgi:hypothetical protein
MKIDNLGKTIFDRFTKDWASYRTELDTLLFLVNKENDTEAVALIKTKIADAILELNSTLTSLDGFYDETGKDKANLETHNFTSLMTISLNNVFSALSVVLGLLVLRSVLNQMPGGGLSRDACKNEIAKNLESSRQVIEMSAFTEQMAIKAISSSINSHVKDVSGI